jgi:hypothetical protein
MHRCIDPSERAGVQRDAIDRSAQENKRMDKSLSPLME